MTASHPSGPARKPKRRRRWRAPASRTAPVPVEASFLKTIKVDLGRPSAKAPADAARAGRADALVEEALRRLQQTDAEGAANLLEQALVLDRRHARALGHLGIVRQRQGQLKEAIRLYRRALAVDGTDVRNLNNLAGALALSNEADQAAAILKHAIELQPGYAHAHYNLGRIYFHAGRYKEAAACYERALMAAPEDDQARADLKHARAEDGRLGGVLEKFRAAIEVGPVDPALKADVRLALRESDLAEEAIELYQRQIERDPQAPDPHNNLGAVVQSLGRIDEALACYRRAIALKPDHVEAHLNLAILLLMQGDFAQGWPEYEWRRKLPAYERWNLLPQPAWQGEPLQGKTILLHHEQGQGDSIQFLRYVPRLLAQGASVVLAVEPPLVRLAASLPGKLRIVRTDAQLPATDYVAPLLSLPGIFGTDATNIPAEVPYLAARGALVERWRKKIDQSAGAEQSGLKIGFAWAGNEAHRNDFNRSTTLEALRPLLELDGCRWFSLQAGPRAADLANLAPGRVVDLSESLRDFAETAGAIANLDLVISVDTAIVHVAGALGKPAWTLLPFMPDWRWQLGRGDSPWYPSLRLFRQTAAGDWGSAIEAVRLDLIRLIGLPQPAAEAARLGAPTGPEAAARADLERGDRQLAAGRIEAALVAYWDALERDPTFVPAMLRAGTACRELTRYDEAEEFYRRAIEAGGPYLALAHAGLSATLHMRSEFDAALAEAERAVALDPNQTTTQAALAHCLQENGRFEAAAEAYRRALALDPLCPSALIQLAKLKGEIPGAVTLERVEEALRTRRLTSGEQRGLYFALGRLAEGRGDYDRAFAGYRTANELQKRELDYRPDDQTSYVERTVAAFDAALFEKTAGYGNRSELPVFIVGMPRSGTTLVEQILASHPDLHGAGELDDFPTIARKLPERLGSLEAYPECIRRLDKKTASALAGEQLKHLAALAPKAKRVTDKLPGNFLRLGLIALLFPHARIIHCVRDPLDICLSCYLQEFTRGLVYACDLEHLGRYYRDYRRLMEHWRAVLPLRMLEVPYEDVVADQEGWTRRLLDFVGLPWDPRCLAFHETERVVHTASFWQVRQPLYDTSVGRWRHYARHLGPLTRGLGMAPPPEASG